MSEATLILKGDAASIVRMFGQVVDVSSRTKASVIRDWQQADTAVEHAMQRLGRAHATVMARIRREETQLAVFRQGLERRTTAIQEAESGKRIRTAGNEAGTRGQLVGEAVKFIGRSETAITTQFERESRRRIDLMRQEGRAIRSVRAEVESSTPRGGGGGRSGGTGRPGRGGGGGGGGDRSGYSDDDFARDLPGGIATAGRLLHAGLAVVGQYGDNIREQHRNRAQLDLGVMRLAAGDINDPTAARGIERAIQSVSENTGMLPEEVLGGISRAQTGYSQLANERDRNTYLTRVLPQLAHTSVATGARLEDVVSTTGEMQRQSGLTMEQLPGAVARSIARGQQGSIGFQDQARSEGVLLGLSGRFTHTGVDSVNLAESLFQVAGDAGGTAAQAATRTRGFLSNLTSGAGRRRLEGLLGHTAFDSSGQLIARNGESQSDAFQRTMEEAWTRSGGNADRFLTATAGNNQNSRILADQFAKNLRASGGHLTRLHELMNVGGSSEDTDRAFAAVQGTEAVQIARQQNRTFFNQTDPNANGNISQTAQQLRDLDEKHPFLKSLLDNQAGRGALDMLNSTAPVLGSRLTAYSVSDNQQAEANVARRMGVSAIWGDSQSEIAKELEGITTGHVTNLAKDSGKLTSPGASGGGGTATIAPESIHELAGAIREVVNSPDTHRQALQSGLAASGANSPPPESRR